MKREDEFKLYLKKNFKPKTVANYLSYCKSIEKSMNNKDMDDIIVDYKMLSAVKDNLLLKGYSKGYISGLNAYLKFAFSAATKLSTTSEILVDSKFYYVTRSKDVLLTSEVKFVCETLEQEYAHIVRFAEELFNKAGFGFIPIVVSNEMPAEGEKILGRFFGSVKPYIEIYYRNFDSYDAAVIKNCLAHEYLHYLHFIYAGMEYDNAKKELKEGMADFFAFIYSINLNGKDDFKIAKNRYNRWKRDFASYWPYASALYFLQICGNEMKYSTKYDNYVKYGCIGKFLQVFLSTEHPYDAYLAMLH